jgi:NADH:ubiquinone oxidoreductase subunit B-like Fe-S oxidoreductase
MRFNRVLPVFALFLVFQLSGCVSNNEELLNAIGKLETRLESIEKKLDKQEKASRVYSIADAGGDHRIM